MEREIPERMAANLRQITNTPADAPLPKKVADAFWELQRCGNRVSDSVGFHDLKWLCFHLGYGREAEAEKPKTILDLWKSKQVKAGDHVLAKWRGKELEGTIQKVNRYGRVIVDIGGEDRELEPADVRVAELAAV